MYLLFVLVIACVENHDADSDLKSHGKWLEILAPNYASKLRNSHPIDLPEPSLREIYDDGLEPDVIPLSFEAGGERYEVVKILGKGYAGDAYLVQNQESLNYQVLKIFHRNLGNAEKIQEVAQEEFQFHDEIRKIDQNFAVSARKLQPTQMEWSDGRILVQDSVPGDVILLKDHVPGVSFRDFVSQIESEATASLKLDQRYFKIGSKRPAALSPELYEVLLSYKKFKLQIYQKVLTYYQLSVNQATNLLLKKTSTAMLFNDLHPMNVNLYLEDQELHFRFFDGEGLMLDQEKFHRGDYDERLNGFMNPKLREAALKPDDLEEKIFQEYLEKFLPRDDRVELEIWTSLLGRDSSQVAQKIFHHCRP